MIKAIERKLWKLSIRSFSIMDIKHLDSMEEKLISSKKVVLFMNGTLEAPICAYSKFVAKVIKNANISGIHVVDLAKNQHIKSALKSHKSFPKLYVKGKLVGGYSEIKALKSSGKLDDFLIESGIKYGNNDL